MIHASVSRHQESLRPKRNTYHHAENVCCRINSNYLAFVLFVKPIFPDIWETPMLSKKNGELFLLLVGIESVGEVH